MRTKNNFKYRQNSGSNLYELPKFTDGITVIYYLDSIEAGITKRILLHKNILHAEEK